MSSFGRLDLISAKRQDILPRMERMTSVIDISSYQSERQFDGNIVMVLPSHVSFASNLPKTLCTLRSRAF